MRGLLEAPGKDIWLFGGGKLFGSMLDAELVESVEVGVNPRTPGWGDPFPQPARQAGHA